MAVIRLQTNDFEKDRSTSPNFKCRKMCVFIVTKETFEDKSWKMGLKICLEIMGYSITYESAHDEELDRSTLS